MTVQKAKKLIFFLNIVLSGLMLWVVYETIVVPFMGTSAQESVAVAPDANPPKSVDNDRQAIRMTGYVGIVSRDIFDTTAMTAPPEAALPVAVEKPIEATRLNLVLNGVLKGDKNAYAVIAEGGRGQESIYKVGETIQDAKILEVRKDRVILDVNGSIEALFLYPENGDADIAATPDPVTDKRNKRRVRRLPGGARPSPFRK